jgi:uncharacterized protein (DUF2062 family)
VIRRYTPSAESLRQSRWLRLLGPRAREAQAWRFDRRRVARGVAIGAFTAVLIPVGQILAAVIAALLLRASPLAAATATFISNPLTIGPIYYGAYQLGAVLLKLAGLRAVAAAVPNDPAGEWLGVGWSMFLSHTQPLLLGVPLLAATAGAIGYLATQQIWRRRVLARRRARRAAFRANAVAAAAFAEPVADEVCARPG